MKRASPETERPLTRVSTESERNVPPMSISFVALPARPAADRFNLDPRRHAGNPSASADDPDRHDWSTMSKLCFYTKALDVHLSRRADPQFDAHLAAHERYDGAFVYDLQKVRDEAAALLAHIEEVKNDGHTSDAPDLDDGS